MRSLAHPPRAAPASRRIAPLRGAVECARAEALLGADHVLVRVLRRSRTAVCQMIAVAAVAGIGGCLAIAKERHGLAFVLAGAVVEAAVGCRLALLRVGLRDACRDLVIAGRDGLPLAALEREVRRLQSPVCRARLARLLDAIADSSGRRPRGCSVDTLVSVSAVRAVRPLLREIAALLRIERCSLRGVALTERLVTFGASALYGTDADRLRRELGRIRLVLSGEPFQRPPAGRP